MELVLLLSLTEERGTWSARQNGSQRRQKKTF